MHFTLIHVSALQKFLEEYEETISIFEMCRSGMTLLTMWIENQAAQNEGQRHDP